jgi:hypothetical protein
MERGVSESRARALVGQYDPQRVLDNLTYADEQFLAGKVKSRAAYVVKAIEADYRPAALPPPEKRRTPPSRSREHSELASLKERFRAFRQARVREVFGALSDVEQATLRDRFEREAPDLYPGIVARLRKQGFDSRMVQSHFYRYAADVLLAAPEEVSFEAYARSHGIERADDA